MEMFEEKVEAHKKRFGRRLIKSIEGVSFTGQKFAVFVTKTIFYTMLVFVDEDFRGLYTPKGKENWIIYKKYFTKKSAIKAAEKRSNIFVNGLFQGKNGYKFKTKPIIINLPKDWSENPDKYLKRADAIMSSFIICANHVGIYDTKNVVIHVSGHGDGKSSAVARIGKLIPDFVDKPTDAIRLKLFRVQFRSDIDIIFDAKKYASENFRDGHYNLFIRNCQHFQYLCTHGYERSDDVHKVKRIVGRVAEVSKAFLKIKR